MKKRNQIEREQAGRRFHKQAEKSEQELQLHLPLKQVAAALQDGVGQLMRQAGLEWMQLIMDNEVRTQIWTALIAMLLLRYLQLRAKFSWSLSNLAALLRQQLFVHREVWRWLDEPFQPPPGLPQTAMKQLALPLATRG